MSHQQEDKAMITRKSVVFSVLGVCAAAFGVAGSVEAANHCSVPNPINAGPYTPFFTQSNNTQDPACATFGLQGSAVGRTLGASDVRVCANLVAGRRASVSGYLSVNGSRITTCIIGDTTKDGTELCTTNGSSCKSGGVNAAFHDLDLLQ